MGSLLVGRRCSMTNALCGVDAPVPVPKSEVPVLRKECPRCIAAWSALRPPLPWGSVETVRMRRGRIAHYKRREP
jgi:hypothetical protein